MQYQLLFASVLAVAGVASAGRPACLLAAVGQQPNPSDMEALCGDALQDAMLGNLTQVCDGSDLTAAYDAFAETCLQEQNVEVADLPTSAKDSSDGGSNGSGSGSSGNGSGSSSDSDSKEDAANGIAPSLVFLVTGLAATSLTGILFL